jgi:hypothetical protein
MGTLEYEIFRCTFDDEPFERLTLPLPESPGMELPIRYVPKNPALPLAGGVNHHDQDAENSAVPVPTMRVPPLRSGSGCSWLPLESASEGRAHPGHAGRFPVDIHRGSTAAAQSSSDGSVSGPARPGTVAAICSTTIPFDLRRRARSPRARACRSSRPAPGRPCRATRWAAVATFAYPRRQTASQGEGRPDETLAPSFALMIGCGHRGRA